MRWYDHTLATTFEAFVERYDGAVAFADRQMCADRSLLERHWPVFSLVKRGKLKRRVPMSHSARRNCDQITESSRLCAARRWLPCNPLDCWSAATKRETGGRRRPSGVNE